MSRRRARPRPKREWVPLERAVRLRDHTPAERDALMVQCVQAGLDFDQASALLDADRETWMNDRYTVTVERFDSGSVASMSIKRNDKRACRDWRDFQRIKNELAGPDCEAVELYPAAERVVDAANQYHLWCLPPGARFPVGFNHGLLGTSEDARAVGARQRDGADRV